MTDLAKTVAKNVIWRLARWAIPTLLGFGWFGPWLTGEKARHRFFHQTYDIICTSIELSGRQAKRGQPSSEKDPIKRLEDEDRELRLQIEVCPNSAERQRLFEQLDRCISAQASVMQQRKPNTGRPGTTAKLTKVIPVIPAAHDEYLRRWPYDAARGVLPPS